ncbi:MAG: hypothetical protein HUJ26_06905 [Planctomycetaceae bacterium]|nr:hypothetical protein [Planctomycetaceae bacterium]
MMFFLQLVGAMFVALLLLILAIYLYIRWKFRSAFGKFADLLKNMGGAAVPPFRIKLKPRSEVLDADDELEDFLNHPDEFEERCGEYESLGFDKIDDYYVEEVGLAITAYIHRASSTYGIVYDHPMAGVWCDVYRKYEDGSSWTFGTNQETMMDYPDDKTVQYHPELSVADVFATFQEEAPSDNATTYPEDEFARCFERAYAEEMDWRISRGGATEAEIRRIAERDGTECTPESVAAILLQWRTAISQFHAERALKRFRKENDLSRDEWEQLSYEAVVVHQEMQAEEILQAFDDEYYPGSPFDMPDETDPEYADERAAWNQKLDRIREQLKTTPPQQILKSMIESSDNPEVVWEFKGSVEQPIPADIWMRKWKDPDEDDDWDDEDDWDE